MATKEDLIKRAIAAVTEGQYALTERQAANICARFADDHTKQFGTLTDPSPIEVAGVIKSMQANHPYMFALPPTPAETTLHLIKARHGESAMPSQRLDVFREVQTYTADERLAAVPYQERRKEETPPANQKPAVPPLSDAALLQRAQDASGEDPRTWSAQRRADSVRSLRGELAKDVPTPTLDRIRLLNIPPEKQDAGMRLRAHYEKQAADAAAAKRGN